MKKIFLILALPMFFINCSKNDNKEEIADETPTLIGEWSTIRETEYSYDDGAYESEITTNPYDFNYMTKAIFNEDGTCKINLITGTGYQDFTYTIEENKMYIKDFPLCDWYEFAYNATQLSLDYYTVDSWGDKSGHKILLSKTK